MTTSSANLDAEDRSRGHVRDVSPSAPSARVWDEAVAEGVSALLESDAMTGNDESPTHYYVDAENVAYLVRTVLTAAADAVEGAIRADERKRIAQAIKAAGDDEGYAYSGREFAKIAALIARTGTPS